MCVCVFVFCFSGLVLGFLVSAFGPWGLVFSVFLPRRFGLGLGLLFPGLGV